MAKGQKRSTKEPKKPKQNKPKKGASAPASTSSQMNELFHNAGRDRAQRKGKR